MEFCPNCGGLLTTQAGRKTGVCAKCGKRGKLKSKIIREKITHEPKKPVRKKQVEEIETLPVVRITCSECGHNKAYFWTQLIPDDDDNDIIDIEVYRCAKCGHTWRET